jgi:hypothetical protein
MVAHLCNPFPRVQHVLRTVGRPYHSHPTRDHPQSPKASVELALEPKPDVSVAAVIEAEAGGLNFVLQDKRRATVNGAALLTVDDVTTLVRAAVVGALLSVADAVDE